MLIQCTKKLCDELKIVPSTMVNEAPMFAWHAHLITIKRRKTMVLVNDSSRYVVVLHGLKSKDFRFIAGVIRNSIQEALLAECIKPEIVAAYLKNAGEVTFGKTHDRSSVAKLNQACRYVNFCLNAPNSKTVFQRHASIAASHCPITDGCGSYTYPNECLYDDLLVFATDGLFDCRAVEMLVRLNLEKHNVWRRIIVPEQVTFKQLHLILQIAFGWKDYHLHDFYVLDNLEPVVNIASDEEAFDYPKQIPMLLETDVAISQYAHQDTRIKYVYDFGDNWEHIIEVVKLHDHFPKNHPICLDGEGNAPPEDVGGESGYDELQNMLSDSAMPSYDAAKKWLSSQHYEPFNMEVINRRFLYVLKRW